MHEMRGHLVSWAEHLKKHGQAVTIPDLYLLVDRFLEELPQEQTVWVALRSETDRIFAELTELIEDVPEELSLLKAQNITLEVFASGMLAGACDGRLLLADQSLDAVREFPFRDDELRASSYVLCKNIGQIRRTVKENWGVAHPDDLHLLKGYAEHENAGTLQEGGQIGTVSSFSLQRFLLATFKGGYATGAIFAAVRDRG